MAEACEYTVEGNQTGPTLVFIHGWPDRASLWRRQVAALSENYRCVLVTLPNFGEKAVQPGGMDFPEWTDSVLAVIKETRHEDEKVTLVTHDWGGYVGYCLEERHPDLIRRVVAFDAGGHFDGGGVKTGLLIVAYQWALIAFWLIGGLIPSVGACLTRAVASVIGVHGSKRPDIHSRMNYPYFYLWRSLFFARWRKNLLGVHYRPRCPVLFLYGKDKTVMWHSAKWLDIVEATGGRWEGIEGAGHWLMESHAPKCNRLMLEFLDGS